MQETPQIAKIGEVIENRTKIEKYFAKDMSLVKKRLMVVMVEVVMMVMVVLMVVVLQLLCLSCVSYLQIIG